MPPQCVHDGSAQAGCAARENESRGEDSDPHELHAHRAEQNRRDHDLAAFILMNALHGLIHAVVFDHAGRVPLKAATREMIRLADAYLTAPA